MLGDAPATARSFALEVRAMAAPRCAACDGSAKHAANRATRRCMVRRSGLIWRRVEHGLTVIESCCLISNTVMDQEPLRDFVLFRNPDGTYSLRCKRCGEMVHNSLESFGSPVYEGLLHTKRCTNPSSLTQGSPRGALKYAVALPPRIEL
jgi:hypothetical protein